MMTDIYLDEEMDMPCPCSKCGGWFDLLDGKSLPGSNEVICEDCHTEIIRAPKGKKRENLHKEDIVFAEGDSKNKNVYSIHGYYLSTLNGTGFRLCNITGILIINDIEYISFEDIKYHATGNLHACKTCKRIYDKLPY